MENETCEEASGPISPKVGLPLDVRIVARILYVIGGLAVLRAILLCTGNMKAAEPYRVLFGTVVLADGLMQAVQSLFMGIFYLLCDWGLRRGMRFVWWFLMVYQMVYSVYPLIWGVFVFPGHSVAVAITIAVRISFIAWLWFRRELYGVHLAADRRKR
ncbi:MAG: hypothetical protein A2Y77_13630 [Planctomycetes bacterium RBG_13_62_9]|nr:MAG: hypothetical protein A2Y77_13630 [Planctomycetes bacterium RBG_13_62_9]